MNLKEVRCEGVDCMHLTKDSTKWRTLVNTVMGLQDHCFLLAGRLSASRIELCSNSMQRGCLVDYKTQRKLADQVFRIWLQIRFGHSCEDKSSVTAEK
jgi:hypothetical protein